MAAVLINKLIQPRANNYRVQPFVALKSETVFGRLRENDVTKRGAFSNDLTQVILLLISLLSVIGDKWLEKSYQSNCKLLCLSRAGILRRLERFALVSVRMKQER